jgi:hypothetical protein
VSANELLLAFVRGDTDWRSLQSIGVTVQFERGTMFIEAGPSQGDVRPEPADIEDGLSAFDSASEARREVGECRPWTN